MIKDLFFDLVRTLWDFERFTDFHASYKQINHELWELYRQHRIVKEELCFKRFIYILETVKVKDKNLAQNLADDYVYISPRQTKLFPVTLNTLKKLKEKEDHLHIITNGFKEGQHIKFMNNTD